MKKDTLTNIISYRSRLSAHLLIKNRVQHDLHGVLSAGSTRVFAITHAKER